MAFYEHFFIGDRVTKVTSAGDILNAPDNTQFTKDTGEIYQKVGNKLLKKIQFITNLDDVGEVFLSKDDDDVFDCSYTPNGNSVHSFGSSSARLKEIHSTRFIGLATSAEYADLAEKYKTDKKYPYGVVLQHCDDGTAEMEVFTGGILAGVVSKNPGLLLNSASEGTYVALAGQTPVICREDIKKGQYCVAQEGGFVKGFDKSELTFDMTKDLVGIALADSEFNYVNVKI